MASFRVPAEQASSVAKLISLPHDVLEELSSALQNASTSMSLEETIREIVLTIDSLQEDDKAYIASVIYSLYMVRASSELTLDEFAEDILESIGESAHEELLKVPEETVENVAPYVRNLFSSDPLFISAKAVLILYENNFIFSGARVLTDVRHVFGEDLSESPKAAVLVHTLRVQNLRGKPNDSVYIALETNELQKIIDVLERAKQKAEILQATLEGSGVSLLERE
ncbi:MAG TPA: hypothetical protein VF611_17420 [Pyrinomonadaceae bacterium]|jgi:hypothetical protein